MIRIKVGFAYDQDWLYAMDDWKDYVCPDFDDNVVIFGNRDYNSVGGEGDWWTDAEEIISDLEYDELDDYSDFMPSGSYASDISPAKATACARLYQNTKLATDDPEFILEIAEILYPKLNLACTTIRGSSQGDWADAIYNADVVDPNILEDFFFGNLVDIGVYSVDEDGDEDLEGSDIMSYTEYSRMSEDELISYVRDMGVVNIPPDEEIEVEDM